MFDIGFTEVLMVILVACLVTDPKKAPSIIKSVRNYYGNFLEIKSSLMKKLKSYLEEEEVNKNSDDAEMILGKDGKMYRTYKLEELTKKRDVENTDS